MPVEIKIWREKNRVLVRNDAYHINTFGKTLEEALENFHEAFLVAIEPNAKPDKRNQKIEFVFSYPLAKPVGGSVTA